MAKYTLNFSQDRIRSTLYMTDVDLTNHMSSNTSILKIWELYFRSSIKESLTHSKKKQSRNCRHWLSSTQDFVSHVNRTYLPTLTRVNSGVDVYSLSKDLRKFLQTSLVNISQNVCINVKLLHKLLKYLRETICFQNCSPTLWIASILWEIRAAHTTWCKRAIKMTRTIWNTIGRWFWMMKDNNMNVKLHWCCEKQMFHSKTNK